MPRKYRMIVKPGIVKPGIVKPGIVKFVFVVLALTLVCGKTSMVSAQNWNTGTGTSGNWSDSSKWVGGVPPVPGSSTILDFAGNTTTDFTATNDLGNLFQLFALRFNIEDHARTATLNGNSLFFEGPAAFNGQSVIEQNGNGVAEIQNNLAIGGVGMTVQGAGVGSVLLGGAVEGVGILKISSLSSTLSLQGGTSGSGLGYLASRSGLIQISQDHDYQFGYLGVADSGSVTGEMEILSQARVTNSGQLVVANNASASGSMTVTGPGAVLEQIGAAFIGNAGVGNFVAEDGGVANFSQTVQVGVLGLSVGTLDADNAELNFFSNVHMGVTETSSGTMTLRAAATMQAATTPGATFTVGFAGEGALNIIEGSRATIGSSANSSPLENELVVGRDATGSGRVSVDNATLIASNAVFGNFGDGRLVSTTNSTVDFGDTLFLGYNSGAYGEVVIRDFSNMTARQVQIGRAGNGALMVSDGGQVSVADTTFVAPLVGSNGYLEIAHSDSSYQTGILTVGGLVTGGLPVQGGEGRVRVFGGALIVNSELILFDQGSIAVASAGSVSVGAGGGINGAITVNAGGKLIGTGRIDSPVIVNDLGVLTPGVNGLGQLQINGDLTFAATTNPAVFGWDLADAGSASSEAGGSSATAGHDQLIVAGGSVTMTNVTIVLSELGDFAASFDATQSYSWKLIEIQGPGSFTALGPFSIVFNGSSEIKNAIDNQWGTVALSIGNVGGNHQFLALSYSAVPEPSGLFLVAGSVLFGICTRWRSR